MFQALFLLLYATHLLHLACSLSQSQNLDALGFKQDETGAVTGGTFIDDLVSKMTVQEMVMQLFLTFADSVVGPQSKNELYDEALMLVPGAGIGVIHDWYPMNKSEFNSLQKLNLEKSRLKVPFMQTGECLHGVGSFKQSMFPQALGMSASFDTDIVHRVGHAIGAEARSIGIHACFAPVLDTCQDPRWGRCQEDWGEDFILTSHMGVAFASGLSKNSSWNAPDAVVPVMKHFAAHGAPQPGLNTAPFMGHGNRQVLQQLLVPFKAAVDLGGVRGVMMAYSELDDVPCSVNPMLYEMLDNWGYNGFIIADDTGMSELQDVHMVSDSPADTIMQWFNAGGMISFYDYPLDVYLNATIELVANGSVSLATLENKVRRILGVKQDLGLFDNPYIDAYIDPDVLTQEHWPLALETAHKSIVLLENRDSILPLPLNGGNLRRLVLVGPFSNINNYGDYSGQFGAYPVVNSTTIRQGMLQAIQAANSSYELLSSSGANTWLYNAQYPIPGYHLFVNGTPGGLLATYYADTNFSQPMVQRIEVPIRDWGLYPPPGLPFNNFSAVWEGTLEPDVDTEVDGWLGIAIGPNSTARVYVNDELLVNVPLTTTGNILSNIPSLAYSTVNSTAPPPGSAPLSFRPGGRLKIRIEFQAWNLYQKIENESSLNAEILFFWNLVDRSSPLDKAISLASTADAVVLALGAGWNSDGENGDRGTLDLSANQTALASAIFALGKPVILILQGGRPFAVPDFYNQSAAVLNTCFLGQAGGQAVADVLFGAFDPGGRLPLTIPQYEGQLPTYYNYKPSAHLASYVDIAPAPMYPFGYGLSYTNFSIAGFSATVALSPVANGSVQTASADASQTFSAGDTITFSVDVFNIGPVSGSYVPQVYLLGRVSQVVQPVKQLVAFSRVYLDAGQRRTVQMELEVERYLQILNRRYEWEIEKGEYTFALLENGGMFVDTGVNVTMVCV